MLILAIAFASTVALLPQELSWCTDNAAPSQDFVLEWGAIHFDSLQDLACKFAPVGVVNGQEQYGIQLTIRQSAFTFLAADGTGAVLHGVAQAVTLRARIALDQTKKAALFQVEPANLMMTVTVGRGIRHRLGGGEVLIPVGTQLSVSNPTLIRITKASPTGQRGSLSLVTAAALSWKGLRASLSELPTELKFDVASRPRVATKWQLSLADNHLTLKQGEFERGSASLPTSAAPLRLADAAYRARINAASLASLTARVADNSVVVTALGVRVRGQAVGRSGAGKSIGSAGLLTIGRITGRAVETAGPLELSDVHVTNAHIAQSPAGETIAKHGVKAVNASGLALSNWRADTWADSSLRDLGLPNFTARRDSAIAEAVAQLALLKSANVLVHASTSFLRKALNASMKPKMGQLSALEAHEQLLTGIVSARVGSPQATPTTVDVIVRLSPSAKPDSLTLRYDVYLPSVDGWSESRTTSASVAIADLVQLGEGGAQLVDAANVAIPLPSMRLMIRASHVDLPERMGLQARVDIPPAAAKIMTAAAVPLVDSIGVHFLLGLTAEWSNP